MSDQQTTEDPVIVLLREKRAAIGIEIAARQERCDLLDELIAEFSDGRTRAGKAVAQRRKGNSKPADTETQHQFLAETMHTFPEDGVA